MLPAIVGLLGRVAGTAATAGGATATGSAAGLGPPAVAQAATGLTGLIDKVKPLAGAIGNVQGKFTELTATAGKVASSVGLVNEPFKAVVGVMGQFRDSVTALGNQVSQFTRLANPALTQRFQFAADDLTASIGRGLLPVLEFATKFTRGFADAVYTLSGPFQRLTSSFLKPISDLIPTITNTLGPVVRTVGMLMDAAGAVVKPFAVLGGVMVKLAALPLESAFSGLAAGMEAITTPLVVAAKLFGELATAIDRFVSKGIADVRRLLGLKDMSGAGFGAAARGVNIGSVESYQSDIIKKAFGMGSASAEERTAGLAADILSWLKSDLPKILADLPGKAAAALWEQIQRHPAFRAASAAASGDFGEAAISAAEATTGLPVVDLVLDAGRRLDKLGEEAERAAADPLGYLGGFLRR